MTNSAELTLADLNTAPKTPINEEKKEVSRLATFAKRESDRIAELEEEVQELRRKLERAEARLAQKEGSAGVLAREVALERELDEVCAFKPLVLWRLTLSLGT
jgi:chromosome segregation ATPase